MSEKLHLTYGVPEPIDIDVGTERAAIHLSPMADELGRHVIKVFDNTGADRNQYLGSVRLEPDPIAAAVQDETERCKMVNLQHLAVEVATLVNNALDAPPEPVSVHGKSATAFRDEAMSQLDHAVRHPGRSALPEGLREAMFIIRRIPTTEPTDA